MDEETILPPGTVRLIDTTGHGNSKHADKASDADIVLHPKPSGDPEDPLNWTSRRKLLATSCILVYTVCVAMPSGSVYSVVKPIQIATGLSLDDLNTGTGVMFLGYGWACVLWQPLALQYGKRPVYLASMMASIAIMGTAPLCVERSTYLANKVLQGFFGAPVEALCEISVADIWFTHERPKYLAWYGFSLTLTGKLAPMLAGFINDGQDWKWVLWWTAIWIGIAFIYCFLLMEETNYDRKAPVHDAEPSPSESKISISPSSPPPTLPMAEKQPTTTSSSSPSSDIEPGTTTPFRRKTFLQKLSILDTSRPNRMLDILRAPFKGFTYPVIVYAGLMYGANNLVWSGIQNATAGTVYTQYYGFSTTDVAAAYAGGLIGACIGSYYAGKVGRLLTLKLARRNNGISEPEHTLYMFIASMVLVPFSMLLWGLGTYYHIHWFGLVFSQTILGISNAAAIAGALNYVISSYHALSGDMVTTCILIRNTLSFAVNYGITPWLNALGYKDTFIMVAVIGFAWNATLFAMIKVGPLLRKRSAARYWEDVARARSKGLSH